MGLDKYFRKYVWDDEKTPYLTPVGSLTRRQADYEVQIYSLFLGVFFAVVGLISISGGPEGRSMGVAFYGFTVVCAAALFIILKSYSAALYLSATPAVALVYVFLYGLGSERALVDTIIVAVILLLLLRYSFRIVAIARVYGELPPAEPDET